MRVIAALCVFAFAFSLSPRSALARRPSLRPEGPPLVWNPEWTSVGTLDYTITGAAAGLALAMAIIPPISNNATGGVLFDDSIRDALRLQTSPARYGMRDTSDVLISMLVTYPFFVDALIVAWWYRRSPDVAYEMAMIDAETLAITAAIQGVTNVVAGRERPYGRTCGTDLPNDIHDCADSMRYRSFFSGHASLAFTSAGLICSHHLRLDLYGGGAPDILACVVGLGLAGATATMRVTGDVHYPTDVITGAFVGTAIGFLVPALHYGFGGSDEERAVEVRVVPASNGVGLVGTF